MTRFTRARITAVIALAIGAAAFAVPLAWAGSGGGKPAFFDRVFDSTGVDPNFCGAGKTIEFDGRFVVNGWIGETGGDEQLLKATFTYRFVLTNPLTGDAVVDSAAGEDTNVIVVGQEDGAHTHEQVANGLRAKLQIAGGPVLMRDVGSFTYRVSFDENGEFTGLEIVSDRGSHDAFDNDSWCQAAIEALRL